MGRHTSQATEASAAAATRGYMFRQSCPGLATGTTSNK